MTSQFNFQPLNNPVQKYRLLVVKFLSETEIELHPKKTSGIKVRSRNSKWKYKIEENETGQTLADFCFFKCAQDGFGPKLSVFMRLWNSDVGNILIHADFSVELSLYTQSVYPISYRLYDIWCWCSTSTYLYILMKVFRSEETAKVPSVYIKRLTTKLSTRK